MSPRSHSEEPGGTRKIPKNKRQGADRRAEGQAKAQRSGRSHYGSEPPPDAVPLEPIFERLINPKTGEQMVRPVARSAGRNGRMYFKPMPLIFGAPVRPKLPVRRSTISLPPRGHADGKDYVWAGHLEKCVDPVTGYVWYEPVVYIVEQAIHPHGQLVRK